MTLDLIPAIHRATHRIGLHLAGLRRAAVSQGEAHVLAQLAQSGPATVGELHEGLAHKRSTLTSILDRLVERGYVTRETGAKDRRTFLVRLTPSGERVARAVYRELLDLERSVKALFTKNDLGAFTKIVAAVEDEAHRRANRT